MTWIGYQPGLVNWDTGDCEINNRLRLRHQTRSGLTRRVSI